MGKLSGEILARGSVLEGLVGSDRIIVRLPDPECLLHDGQLDLPVVARTERSAGGAIEALDAAFELARTGRQHGAGNRPGLSGPLALGHDHRSASDLARPHGDRHAGDEIGEERRRCTRRGCRPNPDHGPADDHIEGHELPSLNPRQGAKMHHGEVNQGSWHRRVALVFRNPCGGGTRRALAPHLDRPRLAWQPSP